jgi:CRISPR/Cas system CSM-associated protein Csm5 (group 7 of RAMP superfamily)
MGAGDMAYPETLKVTLEPITPTHVWSGVEVVVGIDAVMEGGKLKLIDLDRTLSELSEYVIQSLDLTNIRSTLTTLRGRGLLRYKAEVPLATQVNEGDRVRLLSPITVPGSTLKGYIRTALAFYKLNGMDVNDAKKLLDKEVNLKVKPINVGRDVEDRLFKAKKLGKQGGHFDVMTYLSVSDPLTAQGLSYSVRKLIVVDRVSFEEIASLKAITWDKGSLQYDIQISGPPPMNLIGGSRREETLGYLRDYFMPHIATLSQDLAPSKLIESLRAFGCTLVDDEMDKIAGINRLAEYRRLLEGVKESFCMGKSDKCVVVRLGFMTGHEAKTIALFLKAKHPNLYDRIRKYMQERMKRPWDSYTLKLVDVGGTLFGLGWCKLCLET